MILKYFIFSKQFWSKKKIRNVNIFLFIFKSLLSHFRVRC